MDHTKHIRLNENEYTDTVLVDAVIYGPDNEKVGVVSEVHGMGPGARVIVDVGGFLGLGAKPVEIPVKDLELMRDLDGSVHGKSNWTKDQLKELPDYMG